MLHMILEYLSTGHKDLVSLLTVGPLKIISKTFSSPTAAEFTSTKIWQVG